LTTLTPVPFFESNSNKIEIPNSPLRYVHASWKILESPYSATAGFASKNVSRRIRLFAPLDPNEVS
jgi:hypothetical protein